MIPIAPIVVVIMSMIMMTRLLISAQAPPLNPRPQGYFFHVAKFEGNPAPASVAGSGLPEFGLLFESYPAGRFCLLGLVAPLTEQRPFLSSDGGSDPSAVHATQEPAKCTL